MELLDASIDLLHAYLLSYASANCRLAYKLLHRGICTFGTLLEEANTDNLLGRRNMDNWTLLSEIIT